MASSVNRPTNQKQKEHDVNQKLQIFGIISAFSNGKVPSNSQIDVALNSALASRALANPSGKLSSEGRELVADLRDVIEKAKVLLLSKNEGNLIQNFIWDSQNISTSDKNAPDVPVNKDTARQHGNQALDGLRTLGTLILSNGQFRKLLSDATVLLRDMAGDAAQNAANKINPSEERLAQIDRPAEDNTWHDVPSVGDLKSSARDTVNQNKPFSRSDVKQSAANAANSGDPQAGAQNQAGSLRQQASENIPDENKERARELRDNAQEIRDTNKEKSKQYVNKKIPQERRDQTIWRMKKMVAEIQGHEDYQQAIDTLLSLAETYGGHANTLGQNTTGTVKGAHGDNALQSAEANLRTLIERFANSTSADDLFESINNIYRDADRDPELKNWFKSLDSFIRRALKEQGYILTDNSTQEYNKLYDHGNYLLRERYRDHTNRVLDEIKFLGNQFDEDPQNRAFADSMNKLFTHLGNDENGQPVFKQHLVKDLTQVIVPAIFENTRYVPVPRIEYSDPMIDAIVENLVIESDNLFPNSLEVASDNYFKWGRKTDVSKNKNKVMVSVSGIQMDLKDVSYYINKKSGFPSLKDTGIMDLYMGGTGFSFKLALETADKKDQRYFFKVNTVTVDVKNLKVKAKQSNHKLLFNLASPLLIKMVRPAVQKILEQQIREKIHQADEFLYGIYQEANRAAEQAKNDPEQAQNIYQRYVTAAQKKVESGKKKTEEAAANKQANVALTQNDSIFKNIKLPGGISTKATEYQELAVKGDKWESPVFSIGSAAASSNIPKPTPVSRKPHSAASGTIRGRNNLDDSHSNTAALNSNSNYGNGSYNANNNNSSYGNTGASYGGNNTSSYGNTGASYGGNNTSSYGNTGTGYGNNTSGYGTTGTGYDNNTSGYGNSAEYDPYKSQNQNQTSQANGGYGNQTSMGLNNPVLSGQV